MGIKAEETAVIGDQIFTDIYGGNKLNMFTILVKPIATKEFILVRIKRLAEKICFWQNMQKVIKKNLKIKNRGDSSMNIDARVTGKTKLLGAYWKSQWDILFRLYYTIL